jgi:hypothetical protein
VVVGIVVIFAEEYKPSASQPVHESRTINKAASRNIPDFSGERVMPAIGGFPL